MRNSITSINSYDLEEKNVVVSVEVDDAYTVIAISIEREEGKSS